MRAGDQASRRGRASRQGAAERRAALARSGHLNTTDLVAATARLIDIPSVSLDESAIADFIEAQLAGADHLEVTRIDNEVIARTMLDRPYRVILAGHTDTVKPNGNERARLDGDTLHGLGSADMKAGLAVMLELARQVAEPAVDVTYVFYTAEEIAAEHNGLRRLFADHAELLAGDLALLGEPTSAEIEAGCQGTMRAVVTLRGARSHSARPWMGDNAIHKLGPVLERIARYEARRPVIGGCEFREAVQAVFVEGGIAGNVVPDLATVTVNHRFAPDRTPEQAEAFLRDLVGECDGFEVVDMAPAGQPATDHPLLQALIERQGLGITAKLGWTDVARFAEHGIPAANLGPGDSALAHTAEERVERASIERVYEIVRDLITTAPA